MTIFSIREVKIFMILNLINHLLPLKLLFHDRHTYILFVLDAHETFKVLETLKVFDTISKE